MDLDKIKTLTHIKKVRPDFIASSRKIGNDHVLEEWYTSDIALPNWWNDKYHLMKEIKTFGGKGLHKWCIECGKISDNGCRHNIIKL